MKDFYENFRLNMKFYREKLGISQIQLSIECNCGSGTIGGIEAGSAKPSFDMILKIAQALKISPSDLFERDCTKSKEEISKYLEECFSNILKKL